MKTEIVINETETGGVSSQTGFTFKASAKAFKIFIDGIYSDKKKAIIRELFTNAYDAHKEAGCLDRPFEVSAPTLETCAFTVRDFGNSISHENMLTRFTAVFDSTKDNSNDFVGSLGLGRLSPFAYTDSFTVSTFMSGVVRHYIIFINSDSIPELAFVGEEPSSEENGFKVTVPVQLKDCSEFVLAIEKTIKGFDIPPIIHPDIVKISSPDKIGTGWRIFKEMSGISARQGCVLYPINMDILVEHDSSLGILSSFEGLILDFPIGSLDFNASREALGYNERTLLSLTKAAHSFKNIILSETQSSIDKCKNLYEAITLIGNLNSLDFPQEMVKNLTYEGQPIKDIVELHPNSTEQSGVTIYTGTKRSNSSRLRLDNSTLRHIQISPSFKYYVSKFGARGCVSRIAYSIPQRDNQRVYVAYYEDAKGLQKIKRYFRGAPIIDADLLPKAQRVRASGNVIQVGKIEVEGFDRTGSEHTEIIDLKDQQFFITSISGKPNVTRRNANLVLKESGNALPDLEDGYLIVSPKVYYVPKSSVKLVERAGWINIEEPLKTAAVNVINSRLGLFKQFGMSDRLAYNSTMSQIKGLDENYELLTQLPAVHPFKRAVQGFKQLLANHEASKTERSKIQSLATSFSIPIPKPQEEESSEETEILSLLSEIENKYPMILMIDKFKMNGKSKILLDYLQNNQYIQQQIAA